MRVLHIIGGLPQGGTELVLARLVAAMDSRFDNVVISLLAPGVVAVSIRAAGVDVRSAEMSRRLPVAGVARLGRMVAAVDPDVIQTWIYHADLIGGVVGRLRSRAPVAWNVRQSELTAANGRSIRWLARGCAVLSRRIPERIVVNSEAGRAFHERLGYDAQRMVVIPNGFDTNRFRPCLEDRRRVRAELDLGAGPVVGLIGRFDPNKDHATFLAACRRVIDGGLELTAVLAGSGIGEGEAVRDVVAATGMASHARLLGPRDDIPALMNALDVLVCSSLQEGSPNAVGEAMASGVPVVATDVGDVAALVGNSGIVVPSRNVTSLAGGIDELLRLSHGERVARGARGRERIVEQFAHDLMVARYEAMYDELATRRR